MIGQSDATLREIANQLFQAYQSGDLIEPPSAGQSLSYCDAVVIRRRFVSLLSKICGDPIGYKIGFTSSAMREALGIDVPEFGRLFSSFTLDHGETIDAAELGDTYAEPEIAFEMAFDLTGPVGSIQEVLDATRCIRPAIEIVASRIGLASSNPLDMVADNVLASRILVGEQKFDAGILTREEVLVEIANGVDTYTGKTSDVMGHPANAVMWLANHLNAEEGKDGSLRSGDVVMSGSCTRFIEARAGMKIHADFGPLGMLEAQFT